MNQRSRFRIGLGLTAAALLGLTWHLWKTPTDAPLPASSSANTYANQIPRVNPRRPLPAPEFASTSPALVSSQIPSQPAFIAFDSWTTRFLAASPTEQAALLPQGIALATSRRAALAELIRTNPKAALAAAVPMADRVRLPAEVVALLEERISASGPVSLTYACVHVEEDHSAHSHELFRSTVINNRQFTVHVYGQREGLATVGNTSIVGIAVNRDLALSDSRVRVLEAGETAGNRAFAASTLTTGLTADTPLNTSAGPVAVEAEGRIHLLAARDQLPAFEQSLLQREVTNMADNQPGTSTVVGRPTQAWSQGTKKILVIRVDFSDLPGTPINKFDSNATITEDYAVNAINQANGVRDFFAQSSFGKAGLLISPTVAGNSPDVTQVFRVPNTAASYATSGDNDLLHQHATSAATLAGYNLAAYDRIGVVFSNLGSLSGSKITYGGLANVIGPDFWINGAFDFRVVAHELGHTFGLKHANLWKVTDGNPVSLTGTSLEYGNPFDVMGSGDFFENDFGPWNKSVLQWVPDTAVTVANTAGTYRIYRFDSPAANLSNQLSLKVVRDATRDYWIGYRRGTTNTTFDAGAYVEWGYNSLQVGNLLDLNTPGTGTTDAGLPLGQTFTDTAAGITLKPVAQGGSGADEWLDVQVGYQPRIQWSKTSYLVNEQGGSAVLTLNRTSNSTGAVSVNFATAPGTATSPADFTASSGTISWANGDSAPKTITIPVVADALVEGSESFTVTLSGITGGVIVDTPATTVTLADPGARDVTFNSDFINNTVTQSLPLPDGNILICGYFDLAQDSGFNQYPFQGIARISPTGILDTTFDPGTGGNGLINSMDRQPDGKIIVSGDFTSFNGTSRNRIARLNSDGTLDTTFDPGTGANDSVNKVLLQPDGKILIGGRFTSYNGTNREYLARLNSDGSLDTSLSGPNFADTSGWNISSLALQTDGKILIGGAFYFNNLGTPASFLRLTTTGALDPAFSGLTTGADPSFQAGFLGQVYAIVVQPDGKILVGGDFTTFNGVAKTGIARLTTTGAVDTTFAGTANNVVETILLQPDGKVLVGGDFTSFGTTATRLARLSSTGILDTAFAAAGGHGGTVKNLAWQSGGNVILGGDYASFQGSSPSRPLWRFLPGLASLPGTLQFSSDSYAGNEGSNVAINVTRSGGSLGALSVGYATISGTATSADFTAASGVLTWADGDTAAKTITINLTADALAEPSETFRVNLGTPLLGGTILGDRQQATVSVASAFNTWQSQNFTPLEQADTAVSGDLADPDKDGVNNLLEFALGTSPKSATSRNLPVTSLQTLSTSTYLSLTFRRRVPALDLTYVAETSDSLAGPWQNTAVQVGGAISNGDGTETVTFRDNTALTSTNKRFLRLSVTRTE